MLHHGALRYCHLASELAGINGLLVAAQQPSDRTEEDPFDLLGVISEEELWEV